MWTCTDCGEVNTADADRCDVCGLPPTGTVQPTGAVQPTGTVEPAGAVTSEATGPVLDTPPPRPAPVPAPAPRADPDPGLDPMADYPDEPPTALIAPSTRYQPEPEFADDEVTHPYAYPPEPVTEPVAPRRSRLLAPLIAGAALLTALVLAGFLLAPKVLGPDPEPTPTGAPAPFDGGATTTATTDTAGDTPTAESSPAEASPTPTEPPSAGATSVGVVTIGPAVTDARATEIATMFDTYFTGINAKDYASVASVLDPAGTVDPTNQAEMDAFAAGTRTTQDSEITLVEISDSVANVLALVNFRSTQAPGAGPKGRTGETCTRWSINYTLTDGTGSYRILRGTATSRPC